MEEITVVVSPQEGGRVDKALLVRKLDLLKARGLMDAGLVVVDGEGRLLGYMPQNELAFGLDQIPVDTDADSPVRLLREVGSADRDFDLTSVVHRTPLTISAAAPLEIAVEMFAKLGLRHLMVLEDGSGRLVGVIIKKRLVAYLDQLKHA
jgi:chloride channel 3/4/5